MATRIATAGAVAVVVAASIIVPGCDAASTPPAAPAATPAPSASPPAAGARVQPPPVPAPAVTQASWLPEALDELLAPIALYPDVLLGQILAASINAQEVLDGGNWLLQNQSLTGEALDAAAAKTGFGPAMRALFQFPSVVDMLCQEIDWTRQLGSAFTSDQKGVLDAVQRLRAQAASAGHLKSTPQQTVEQKKEGDTVIVEVKPADPKIVYVPQYDPQVVYAAPPSAAESTTTSESTVSTSSAVAGGLIAFGVGVVLGSALNDDDYCYPHWGAGAVYYGPRPFYPPAHVYRPVYGAGFHPAFHYTSPPGYRHAYNNINVNRNLVVNQGNYFKRFDSNRNLTDPRRPHAEPRAGRETWKGQSTYAGERDTPARRNTSAGSARPRVEATRASEPRAERVDRGYGAATRDSVLGGDLGPNDASFDRAASARGRASMGGRDARGSRRR